MEFNKLMSPLQAWPWQHLGAGPSPGLRSKTIASEVSWQNGISMSISFAGNQAVPCRALGVYLMSLLLLVLLLQLVFHLITLINQMQFWVQSTAN